MSFSWLFLSNLQIQKRHAFEGSPENENSTSFSAAIIGCMDSEETIVNLSVDNEVLELMLLRNGTTIQNTWNEPQFNENLHPSRQKRSPSGWKETGGSIPSTQPRPNQNRVTKEDLKIPKAITFSLDLGYDYSLYDYFGSHQDTKQYIQKIVSAAIPFFNLPRTGLPL